MRLTVLNQYAKGLTHSDPTIGIELSELLKSAKWSLWHGNVKEALEKLEISEEFKRNVHLHPK